MMLTLEVRRRPGAGAEMHRILQGTATIGASSGNEVVVRARGVFGRHVRLFEREGRYYLDVFKGIGPIQLNGREFSGGSIATGDRITIGEATITVVEAGAAAALRPTPVGAMSVGDVAHPPAPAGILPTTEVEYRGLRLQAYRICRDSRSPDHLATDLTDFLDRELPPSEWAVGEFSAIAGFRPLSSTFRENPALPPAMVQGIRAGERLTRAETVTGVLTLLVEPLRDGAGGAAILVRETPRLAARAVLFLEELVQVAGIAFGGLCAVPEAGAARQTQEVPAGPAAAPSPEPSPAETIMRQTDDLKKIVETAEREVIDRAMRRVEGNQSRGAQILNISRGSLIAKLKEYAIPDYRYLRRERSRRT